MCNSYLSNTSYLKFLTKIPGCSCPHTYVYISFELLSLKQFQIDFLQGDFLLLNKCSSYSSQHVLLGQGDHLLKPLKLLRLWMKFNPGVNEFNSTEFKLHKSLTQSNDLQLNQNISRTLFFADHIFFQYWCCLNNYILGFLARLSYYSKFQGDFSLLASLNSQLISNTLYRGL